MIIKRNRKCRLIELPPQHVMKFSVVVFSKQFSVTKLESGLCNDFLLRLIMGYIGEKN